MFHILAESGLCIMLNYLYQNNIETFWIWIILSYTIHVSQWGQICTAWFCFWNTCICNFKKLSQFRYDIIYWWFSSSWFHAWITNYYFVIHVLFIFMDNISINKPKLQLYRVFFLKNYKPLCIPGYLHITINLYHVVRML